MYRLAALLASMSLSAGANSFLTKASISVNGTQDLAHMSVNTSLVHGHAIERGTKGEERTPSLESVKESMKGFADALFAEWKNSLRSWADYPVVWDTEIYSISGKLREDGLSEVLHDKSEGGLLAQRGLPSIVGGYELLGDDTYGVEAMLEANHIRETDLLTLVTKLLKQGVMNDDIISLTAERLQYGLFRRWWGKKTTPSEVEKLLMGEDEVLDDVHIEAFVRYFVLYSKAAFASLIKEPSSALLLNDREIAIFHKILHYPGLKAHLNLDDIFEKYCQGAALTLKSTIFTKTSSNL